MKIIEQFYKLNIEQLNKLETVYVDIIKKYPYSLTFKVHYDCIKRIKKAKIEHQKIINNKKYKIFILACIYIILGYFFIL